MQILHILQMMEKGKGCHDSDYHELFELGGGLVLKSEKRESQKFKKRYGPRRHKMLGINKWTRKRKEIREGSVACNLQATESEVEE